MSNEKLEHKLFEEHVILQAMTSSVRDMKKKLVALENVRTLPKKSNKELMKSYGEENVVVEKSVKKLVESFPTRLVGMEMCNARAIPKRCLIRISQPDYFSDYLRRNWTNSSERSFGSSTVIVGRDRMV